MLLAARVLGKVTGTSLSARGVPDTARPQLPPQPLLHPLLPLTFLETQCPTSAAVLAGARNDVPALRESLAGEVGNHPAELS